MQSSLILKPSAQSSLVVTPQPQGLQQAFEKVNSTPFVALVDTQSLLESSSFVAGRLTGECAASTTARSGYQHALAEYTAPFLSVCPGFDPASDTLDILIDMLTTQSAATGLMIIVGVVDSLTVDASRVGLMFGWSQVLAGTDRIDLINATGTTASVAPATTMFSHATGKLAFGDDGTDAPSNLIIGGIPDAGTILRGTASTPRTLRGTPADWHFVIAVGHRTTTEFDGQTFMVDVYKRVQRGIALPFT